MNKLVGIDLGTTHSLIAHVEKGQPVVLSDSDGMRLLPSVVALKENGRVLVGHEALAFGSKASQRMVYSFKRFMGRGLSDVRDTLGQWPFDFSFSSESTVRIVLGDRRFTPVELSSLVLKRLKGIAAAHGLDIKPCVLTVPAYFNDAQRQATITAGKLAGLEILRLVNEPTAACLAYGLDRKRDGIVAVYDLGGGTFDVSILKLKDGVFEVLSTHGDTVLGGDDLNWALVAHLQDVLRCERGLSDEIMTQLREPLRVAAEIAKKELSSAESTVLALEHPLLGDVWRHSLERLAFESLIAPLLERTVHSCHQALKDAQLEPTAISDVVLVGGSTRIPLVKRLVQGLFGRVPNDSLNPDEVVALGAAIQADVLAFERDDVLLLDVVPLSLGLETLGGAVSKLIPRNTTLPTSAKDVFTTSVDFQTAVTVHVVQGERELVSECRSLARFSIPVEPAPAGIPRVEIKFSIDANGTLQATGKDLRTGNARSLTLQATFGLEEAEIEQLIQDSIQHADEDAHARELIELRQEAGIVLAATEKALRGPAVEHLDAEERSCIGLGIAVLRKALEGTDSQLLKQALAVLNAETRHLAELVMTTTLKALASGE